MITTGKSKFLLTLIWLARSYFDCQIFEHFSMWNYNNPTVYFQNCCWDKKPTLSCLLNHTIVRTVVRFYEPTEFYSRRLVLRKRWMRKELCQWIRCHTTQPTCRRKTEGGTFLRKECTEYCQEEVQTWNQSWNSYTLLVCNWFLFSFEKAAMVVAKRFNQFLDQMKQLTTEIWLSITLVMNSCDEKI